MRMWTLRQTGYCCWLILLLTVTALHSSSAAEAPILGGPCEGCELVFDGLPDSLSSSTQLVPPDYPGERLVLSGTVRTLSGDRAENAVVYAYQTDSEGIYPAGSTRHGAIRGWVRTDASGRYRFETIRPGSYPNTRIPQHIHLHIIEWGRGTYYIDDVVFGDDPLLGSEPDAKYVPRGGSGRCHPVRNDDGTWEVERNIVLGLGISDYPDD